jgi:hypothetical protein
VAVTVAMNRDLQDRFRLATVAGLGAALATWLLNGYLRFDGQDSLGTAAAGGSAFGVVGAVAVAVPYIVPREWRVLDAVFAVARRSARIRRAAYGDPSVPATPRQARAWLLRHPDDTDATRGARIWAHLVIGDLETAHRLTEQMPDEDAKDRFHGAAAEALVRLVEGGDPSLDDLRRAAGDLDDAERSEASIDIALLEALVAAADGRDWRVSLLEVRGRVERATGVVLLRWFLPIIGLIVLGALAMSFVAYAFSIVVD